MSAPSGVDLRLTRRATTCFRPTQLRASFVDDPLFMYEVAERIQAKPGHSLGDIYDPYFDRSARHFSGHVNTPSQPDPSGFDAGSEKGAFVYMAHPLFTAYKRIGAVAMLEIAENVVAHALGRQRMIETTLPRAGRATIRRQAQARSATSCISSTRRRRCAAAYAATTSSRSRI